MNLTTSSNSQGAKKVSFAPLTFPHTNQLVNQLAHSFQQIACGGLERTLLQQQASQATKSPASVGSHITLVPYPVPVVIWPLQVASSGPGFAQSPPFQRSSLPGEAAKSHPAVDKPSDTAPEILMVEASTPSAEPKNGLEIVPPSTETINGQQKLSTVQEQEVDCFEIQPLSRVVQISDLIPITVSLPPPEPEFIDVIATIPVEQSKHLQRATKFNRKPTVRRQIRKVITRDENMRRRKVIWQPCETDKIICCNIKGATRIWKLQSDKSKEMDQKLASFDVIIDKITASDASRAEKKDKIRRLQNKKSVYKGRQQKYRTVVGVVEVY